jgi:hypothetical protein
MERAQTDPDGRTWVSVFENIMLRKIIEVRRGG